MESFSHCAIKGSFIKLTFTASWSKSVTVYTPRTGARLQNNQNFAIDCHAEHLHFGFEGFFTAHSSSQGSVDNFKISVCCPSERVVCLIERRVTIKWLKNYRDQHQVSVLERCPSYNGVREERVDCIPLGGEGLGGICKWVCHEPYESWVSSLNLSDFPPENALVNSYGRYSDKPYSHKALEHVACF